MQQKEEQQGWLRMVGEKRRKYLQDLQEIQSPVQLMHNVISGRKGGNCYADRPNTYEDMRM